MADETHNEEDAAVFVATREKPSESGQPIGIIAVESPHVLVLLAVKADSRFHTGWMASGNGGFLASERFAARYTKRKVNIILAFLSSASADGMTTCR